MRKPFHRKRGAEEKRKHYREKLNSLVKRALAKSNANNGGDIHGFMAAMVAIGEHIQKEYDIKDYEYGHNNQELTQILENYFQELFKDSNVNPYQSRYINPAIWKSFNTVWHDEKRTIRDSDGNLIEENAPTQANFTLNRTIILKHGLFLKVSDGEIPIEHRGGEYCQRKVKDDGSGRFDYEAVSQEEIENNPDQVYVFFPKGTIFEAGDQIPKGTALPGYTIVEKNRKLGNNTFEFWCTNKRRRQVAAEDTLFTGIYERVGHKLIREELNRKHQEAIGIALAALPFFIDPKRSHYNPDTSILDKHIYSRSERMSRAVSHQKVIRKIQLRMNQIRKKEEKTDEDIRQQRVKRLEARFHKQIKSFRNKKQQWLIYQPTRWGVSLPFAIVCAIGTAVSVFGLCMLLGPIIGPAAALGIGISLGTIIGIASLYMNWQFLKNNGPDVFMFFFGRKKNIFKYTDDYGREQKFSKKRKALMVPMAVLSATMALTFGSFSIGAAIMLFGAMGLATVMFGPVSLAVIVAVPLVVLASVGMFALMFRSNGIQLLQADNFLKALFPTIGKEDAKKYRSNKVFNSEQEEIEWLRKKERNEKIAFIAIVSILLILGVIALLAMSMAGIAPFAGIIGGIFGISATAPVLIVTAFVLCGLLGAVGNVPFVFQTISLTAHSLALFICNFSLKRLAKGIVSFIKKVPQILNATGNAAINPKGFFVGMTALILLIFGAGIAHAFPIVGILIIGAVLAFIGGWILSYAAAACVSSSSATDNSDTRITNLTQADNNARPGYGFGSESRLAYGDADELSELESDNSISESLTSSNSSSSTNLPELFILRSRSSSPKEERSISSNSGKTSPATPPLPTESLYRTTKVVEQDEEASVISKNVNYSEKAS